MRPLASFARRPRLAVGLLLTTIIGCNWNGCGSDDVSPTAGAPPGRTVSSSILGSPSIVASKSVKTPTVGATSVPTPARGKDTEKVVPDTVGNDVSVDADAEPDSGGVPLTVTFTGQVEGGPQGLRYRWDFGDDSPPVRQLRAEHTYEQPGDYTATFSVTGPDVEEFREVNIEVTEEGFDFDLDTDTDIGTAPLTVEFTASLDEDLPGPFYFQWDFGDGARDVSNPTNHTYREPGEYTATVTVMNAQGQQATQDVEITVDAPDDTAPGSQ
jgi:PKD repeat protein